MQMTCDNGLLDPGPSGRDRQGESSQVGYRQGRELAHPGTGPRASRAADASTCKGKRDRAILAVFLVCGLRREQLLGVIVGPSGEGKATGAAFRCPPENW